MENVHDMLVLELRGDEEQPLALVNPLEVVAVGDSQWVSRERDGH